MVQYITSNEAIQNLKFFYIFKILVTPKLYALKLDNLIPSITTIKNSCEIQASFFQRLQALCKPQKP